MIPKHLHSLFWDIDLDTFSPGAYPEYAIFRVLEFGDEEAVAWIRNNFSEPEVCNVIRSEGRLSPRSANFWALIYGLPTQEVAALKTGRSERF
jgi:hypothetical protein